MPAPWIVRHGAMRFLGEFDPEMAIYARGDEVVVRLSESSSFLGG